MAYLFDVGEDVNSLSGEEFFGDGTGGDSGDGFAGAGSSAASVVAAAVLGVEGEVGVAGAVLVLDLRVVLRPLVQVAERIGRPTPFTKSGKVLRWIHTSLDLFFLILLPHHRMS